MLVDTKHYKKERKPELPCLHSSRKSLGPAPKVNTFSKLNSQLYAHNRENVHSRNFYLFLESRDCVKKARSSGIVTARFCASDIRSMPANV